MSFETRHTNNSTTLNLVDDYQKEHNHYIYRCSRFSNPRFESFSHKSAAVNLLLASHERTSLFQQYTRGLSAKDGSFAEPCFQ